MNTKLLIVSLIVALAAPAVVPLAEANHCGPVIVFGRVAQVAGQNAGANAGGAGCAALNEGAPDVREITPGSPNLQVRFVGSFAATTLTGTLNGLGLDNVPVTLTKSGSVYDSQYVPIDPLATGSVVATVTAPTGTFSITFTKSA